MNRTSTFALLDTIDHWSCRWRLLLLGVLWVVPGLLAEKALAAGGTVYAWGYNSFGECNVPAGLNNVVEVACGNYFSIALKADGSLSAWGDNSWGLANFPPAATSLMSISTRGYDCLALRRDGTLVQWGDTGSGQASFPPGATNIVAIATGGGHHLALGQDGTLFAWGANNYGQCNIPLEATNVIAIGAGYTHSLVLRKDGHLVAWGEDQTGQTEVPPGATNIVAISVGPDFNLALRADGQLFAWGLDWGGNLPVPAEATNVVAISAGESPDFAVRADGSVVAWGRNDNGELNVPSGLRPAFSIGAGNFHSLGIRVTGTVSLLRQPSDRVAPAGDSILFNVPAIGQVPLSYQWRFNGMPMPGETSAMLLLPGAQSDQAGAYDLVVRNAFGAVTSQVAHVTVLAAPPRITLAPTNQVVSMGSNVRFAVRAKGSLPLAYQWQHESAALAGQTNEVLLVSGAGFTDAGNYSVVVTNSLGSATGAVARLEVVPVFAWGSDQSGVLDLPLGLTNVVALAAGQSHSVALKADATALGWGDNDYNESLVVAGLTNLAAVAAGGQFSLVLSRDGTARAYGDIIGAPADATNVAAIAAGPGYCLLLKSNGTAFAWGWNYYPSPPASATNLVAIAAGLNHSLALRRDGSLLGWGTAVATPPAGISNFISIAAGYDFSVGLHSDGTVLAWGSNSWGQTNIPPEATNIVAIAAGNYDAIAARDDGRVLVWGNTNSGQGAVPAALNYPSAIAAGNVHCLALMDTGPLRLARQPLDQTVAAGTRVSVSGYTLGPGPITYQWLCDGNNVPGATHAYLTIPDAQDTNMGGYSLVAVSAEGSVTSLVATITVVPSAPVIVGQPASLQVKPGQAANFSVSAQGTEPLSYQWWFAGAPLPNATNSTLSLTNAQVLNSGNYQSVVANGIGSVTSAVARLDVYPLNLLTAFTNASGSWSGAWGDFDNDGRLDLLVAGRAGGSPVSATAMVFRNAGNGSFVQTNLGLNVSSIAGAWADFDNDGGLDMVLTTLSDAKVFRNLGNGTFSNLNISLPADYGTAASVMDFDRDGKLDILLGGRLYRNLGGNRFTNVNASLPSTQYSCTAWGDYDNDGWPDLLMCGLMGANARVQLYRNLGNGTFTNVNVGFTNVYRGAVAWLDFDRDGKLDALVAGQNPSGTVAVTVLYRNNGDGTFTPVTSGLPALSYSSLAVADFDNDGQPDVFLSGSSGTGYVGNVYHGLPSGLFTQVVSPLPTNLADCAAWGDYDGDGRLDLALSTSIAGSQNTVGIYRNDTPISNTVPVAPAGLSADAAPSAIRFTWSPASDAQTPAGALSYNVRVGSTPGGTDVLAPSADASGLRRLPAPGNAGATTRCFLTNLPFGQYYWSAQSLDSGLAGSPFAPEQVFTYACYTLPPTNITSSQATLLGVMTAGGLLSGAYFEWGSGTNYDNRTPGQSISASATNLTISATLAGLLPGSGYTCRLVVTNQAGRSTGGAQAFTTVDVPQITPEAATNISATGATLNALVNPKGSPTTVYFEYGLTRSYGSTSASWGLGGGTTALAVAQAISGLIGGQVYHYHVVASNIAGVSYSADLTFATTQEPEVATLAANNIGPDSAVLNGSVRPNTLSTVAYFEYGLTTNYGSATLTQALGAGTNLLPVGAWVGNLTRVTTYHYRIVATNSYATTYGADRSFITTNDVIALPATNLGMSNATLNGLVSPNGLSTTVLFEYGLSTNFSNHTAPRTLTRNTNLLQISWDLAGLASGSNYYFRVVATNDNGVRFSSVLSFQTLPPFTVLSPALAGSINGSMAWGDYDNDGKLDMLVTDAGSTRLYHNLGAGAFATVTTSIPGVSPGAAAWGDYDNDGWLDILITGNSSSGPITRIYRNNQDGTFTDIGAGLPAVAFRTAQWGDFDNDGRPDVLLVGETNSVGLTLIYHNNGDGTFRDSQAPLPGFLDAAAACADYDNDGRLDVLLMGRVGIWYSNVFAKIFHNDGHGAFHETPIALDGTRLGFADWGDFDGDGRLDLVLGGNGSSLSTVLRLYRNNGDGTFTNATGSLPQFAPDAALWGDFDNDGRPDILIRGQWYYSSVVPSNSYSAVLHNKGDGTFTTWNFPLPEIWSSSGGWADYDNNGRLDVAISGNSRTGAMLKLYRNNTPATNTPPAAPQNLISLVSSNGVVLTWDKSSDAQSSSSALSYNVRIGLTPGGGEILSARSAGNGWRRVVGLGSAGTATQCLLTNLAPGLYYWSAQAVDSAFAGSAFAAEQSFEISGAPLVLTLAPTNVLATSARLRASVAINGLPSGFYFEWGDSTNVENTSEFTFTNSPGTQLMTAQLAGLKPATVYYFRGVAISVFGTSLSQLSSFQTVSPPGAAALSFVPLSNIQLQFTGTPGAGYHVQASTNLVNWFDLGLASNLGSNQFRFIDFNGSTAGKRFYRSWTP